MKSSNKSVRQSSEGGGGAPIMLPKMGRELEFASERSRQQNQQRSERRHSASSCNSGHFGHTGSCSQNVTPRTGAGSALGIEMAPHKINNAINAANSSIAAEQPVTDLLIRSQQHPLPPVNSSLISMADSAANNDGDLTDRQNDDELGAQEAQPTVDAPEEGDSDDDDDTDDEHSRRLGQQLTGAYDPNEYRTLPVNSEVKQLFAFIEQYQPQTLEIDPMLKPFIPDFIPAVGDIDAFIKIPRPDGAEDQLGLTVLDEPCAKQTDPTVLDLRLRAVTKTEQTKEPVVKQLQRGDKHAREIEQWITNINELHKTKPATAVHYTKPMPDIDTLMQEWPADFEDTLRNASMPSADMDMPLSDYVDTVCALVDIPVHKSRIQALYHLFSLYLEFKNSHHFKQLADDNQLDNELKSNAEGIQGVAQGGAAGGTRSRLDRLEL